MLNDQLGEVNLIISPGDCDLECADTQTPLVYEKEHAYVGKFRKGDTQFELTEDFLLHVAGETNRYIEAGNKVNLPVEHTTDPEKNRGNNTKWSVRKDSKGRIGLFSRVEFRDQEAVKLAKTAQTSVFIPPKHRDGLNNEYTRTVRHVALTDYPVIPGLDGFTPIAASFVSDIQKGTNMPVKDLAANIGLQLSEDILVDEDKTFELIASEFKTRDDESKKLKQQLDAVTLELSDYKKLNPPKVDPLRVSKAQIAMLRENRELKLSQLVKEGKILTCVAEKLKESFCDESTLTLSLSEDKEDNFSEVIKALMDNDPIKLSEVTGPQTSDVGTLLSSKTNPMMAVAERIAAERK